jgi:hypothetical protein
LGYAYLSHKRLLPDSRLRHIPILLRGDSYRLVPRRGAKAHLSAVLSSLLRRLLHRRYADHWVMLAPHAGANARFQAPHPRWKSRPACGVLIWVSPPCPAVALRRGV